jgi:hypothetical protein
MELVVERTSTADLMAEAERLAVRLSSDLGALMPVVGELDRREGWRSEGATSGAAWAAQRLGMSEATGRIWSHVAERLWDLPHLARGLQVGAITFDKVRAVVDLATPETDAALLRQAEECSVRQLTDLARNSRRPSDKSAANDYDSRYLRFNDARRTITVQLPQDLYALAREAISNLAKELPSDGETPFEHRLCDSLVQLCLDGGNRTGGSRQTPYFVVAHTDLSLLQGGNGMAEIERLGLLSPEAIRRITCDSLLALAVDDAFGHTMFEGRSKRFATAAQRREVARRDRHCRFPGCSNSIFTNVHHVVHWSDQGPTDLPNLVTLCRHHHTRVHEGGWKMTGNANGILRFTSPDGHLMTSRPSPLWTRRT